MVRAANLATAIAVEGLSFSYGKRQALRDISFTIHPGETVILLGPNGAGKTTLFSLITGLFAHRVGRISIGDIDIGSNRSAALTSLGVVFQAQTLDLDLTVAQNLSYFCALRGMARADAKHRIEEALDHMGMAHRAGEKVRNLNGGHRRRVEIARASIGEPKLLLLDEPTVGLDIPTRKSLIASLHDKSDPTAAVLWATHLIDEVGPTDRVLVLHEGRLVADGNAEDFLKQSGTTNLSDAFTAVTSESPKAPVGVTR